MRRASSVPHAALASGPNRSSRSSSRFRSCELISDLLYKFRLHACYSESGCAFHIELGCGVPFMSDVAHDHSAVEGHAACRKSAGIRKEAGVDLAHIEWIDMPAVSLEQQPVEPFAIRCCGVAERA